MQKQERDRLRYAKNREYILAQKKVKYDENKEEFRRRANASYPKRKNKIKAYKQLRNTLPIHRARALLYSAKNRAIAKKLPFDIDESDIIPFLSGSCPYTNVPFDLKLSSGRNPWAPSIDQIMPGLGYVRKNIEVVSVWWNTAKSNWPESANKLALQGLARKAWPWQ